jgi:GAF domain-containing protein
MISDLRAVVEAADELITCPDIDTLFRRAVELAREKLGIERCAIFVKDNGRYRSTYGTDHLGRTTDERSLSFPIDEVWKDRFRLLRPDEPKWFLIEEPRSAWDGNKVIIIDEGWVAVTLIQSSHDPILPVGVFVNDSAITGGPVDEVMQEFVAEIW